MPIFAIGKIFCWTWNISWLQILRRKASPTISRCIYKTWVSIPMTITISFKVTKDNCWKFSKHKLNIQWYKYVKLIYSTIRWFSWGYRSSCGCGFFGSCGCCGICRISSFRQCITLVFFIYKNNFIYSHEPIISPSFVSLKFNLGE